TKRGESMAFITVSDESGEIEAVVFPALYREVNPILNESQIIYVEGKVSYHDNAKQITVDNISSTELEVKTNNVPSLINIKVIKHINNTKNIYVEGKVRYHDKAKQITVDNITSTDLEVMTNNVPSFIYIKVTKEKHQKEVLSFLKNVANDNPGETMIILFNEYEKKTFKLTDDYHVTYSKAVLKE